MERIKNIGLFINRCRTSLRERAFTEKWLEWNKGAMFQHGILQMLCSDQSNIFRIIYRPVLTKRDRYIAATVIQWLGTNVGFSFLQECLEHAGYKVIPKNSDFGYDLQKEYFNVFQQQWDSSYWYNSKSTNKIPQKIKKFHPKVIEQRKHLWKYLSDYRYKCQRCNQVVSDTNLNYHRERIESCYEYFMKNQNKE